MVTILFAIATVSIATAACSAGEESFEERVQDRFLTSRHALSLDWRGELESIQCGDGARYRFTQRLYGCTLTFAHSGAGRWAVVEGAEPTLRIVPCPRPPSGKVSGPVLMYGSACWER